MLGPDPRPHPETDINLPRNSHDCSDTPGISRVSRNCSELFRRQGVEGGGRRRKKAPRRGSRRGEFARSRKSVRRNVEDAPRHSSFSFPPSHGGREGGSSVRMLSGRLCPRQAGGEGNMGFRRASTRWKRAKLARVSALREMSGVYLRHEV